MRRARSRDQLEGDNILITFGLLFVVQGVMLVLFGGAYYSYAYLAVPVKILGATVAVNRLLAFGVAVVLGLALYYGLSRTRAGTAVREEQGAGEVGKGRGPAGLHGLALLWGIG